MTWYVHGDLMDCNLTLGRYLVFGMSLPGRCWLVFGCAFGTDGRVGGSADVVASLVVFWGRCGCVAWCVGLGFTPRPFDSAMSLAEAVFAKFMSTAGNWSSYVRGLLDLLFWLAEAYDDVAMNGVWVDKPVDTKLDSFALFCDGASWPGGILSQAPEDGQYRVGLKLLVVVAMIAGNCGFHGCTTAGSALVSVDRDGSGDELEKKA